MLGIFGTLNLATRSLATQQVGTEVAGNNLANVNNSAYARQRVVIQTAVTIPSNYGPQGTGAEVVAIQQIRDELLDRQVQNETSVRGWLEAQQQALQYAQANLGQAIDRQATGIDGSTATGGVSGQYGVAEALSDFFNAWQSLSTNPTSSAERQVLLLKAENLGIRFNQVADRLDEVNTSLNNSLSTNADDANRLINDIAKLNEQIVAAEVGDGGTANDLRDVRQQRLEDLAVLVNFTPVEQSTGAVDLVIDGQNMISGAVVTNLLETYDPGTGQLLLRTNNTGIPLNITGGEAQGTIEVRDGALADLRTGIDQLASTLITQVNALHVSGYDLDGNTGASFFSGTDAASIALNSTLQGNPNRIQAAATPGTPGDNTIALSLAQLADANQATLGNQTLSQFYGQTVAELGQALSSVNAQLDNQEIVENMIRSQRDSVTGVSLDEEMTDLIRFQRAFQASARLVSTLDEMLVTLVNLGR